MVNSLLDRYERRAVAMEARLDEQDKRIAALTAELAMVSPRAKLADILEDEIGRLQRKLDAAEKIIRDHGFAQRRPSKVGSPSVPGAPDTNAVKED
jgi:hypothetical protein